jgi:hypothetical protein
MMNKPTDMERIRDDAVSMGKLNANQLQFLQQLIDNQNERRRSLNQQKSAKFDAWQISVLVFGLVMLFLFGVFA